MFEQVVTDVVNELNRIGYTATADVNARYHDQRQGEIIVRDSKIHKAVKSSETYIINTDVTLFLFGSCNFGAILEHFNVTEVNEDHENASRELGADGTLDVIKIRINYQSLKSVSCLIC